MTSKEQAAILMFLIGIDIAVCIGMFIGMFYGKTL